MLIRYKTGPGGKPVKQALVYTAAEHGISQDFLDFDAIKIVKRLQRAGFVAYIVGGAVRDLMLGKIPKDFDIATSAEPNQIRRLFRNSRVIGKRFRLVHIFFPDGKIIEVSTFRSREAEGFKNLYGDIEEDALRRDFTLNGLYYDPSAEQVLDFSGGVEDIRAHILRPIIPLGQIFIEDPVRMVRAVKYATSTGSRIPWLVARRVRKDAKLLGSISESRLGEEVFKILQSGRSAPTFQRLIEFGLFRYLLPGIDALLQGSAGAENSSRLFSFLVALDGHVSVDKEDRRSRFLAFLCADYFYRLSPWKDMRKHVFPTAFQGIKQLIRPLCPANKDVEQAVIFLIRQRERYEQSGVLLSTRESGDSTLPEPVDLPSARKRRRPRRRKPRNQDSVAAQ